MSVGDGQAGARPSHFTAETKPWINIKRKSYTWELKSDTAACSNKSVNKYQDENEKLSTSCIQTVKETVGTFVHWCIFFWMYFCCRAQLEKDAGYQIGETGSALHPQCCKGSSSSGENKHQIEFTVWKTG